MKHTTGTGRRSSLFLIELMISIFFFAIASSVCIQLFAKAKLTGDQSSAANQALLQAQSAASVFYAGNGTLHLLSETFPDAAQKDTEYGQEHWEIFFDADWNFCPEGTKAVYRMTVSAAQTGTPGTDADALSEAEILVETLEPQQVLQELSLKYHEPAAADIQKGGSSS